LLFGWQWHAGQRPNANIQRRQFSDITHAAINHHAGPAVARRGSAQVATEQCSTQRSCPVNHQNLANAALWGFNETTAVNRRLDQRVVFKTLDRRHRTEKDTPGAEVAKSRRQNPEQVR